MRLSLTSGNQKAETAFADFIRYSRMEIPQGLRFQGRQMASLLIKLTPPRNRSQGRKAVQRDIRRAVRPLRYQDFDNKTVKEAVRSRNYEALRAIFARSSGVLHNAQVEAFTPELHRKAQDRRGRVRRWKRVVTPDADAVKFYIASVQHLVGQGKGGWAAALMDLGGKPAQWIANHAESGTIEDKADNPVSAYILMTNRSRWASGGDDDRIVENAIKTRTDAIKTYITERQAVAASRSGLKATTR